MCYCWRWMNGLTLLKTKINPAISCFYYCYHSSGVTPSFDFRGKMSAALIQPVHCVLTTVVVNREDPIIKEYHISDLCVTSWKGAVSICYDFCLQCVFKLFQQNYFTCKCFQFDLFLTLFVINNLRN